MEMRQIRYFLAVADELNFSRAAAKCNVTPQDGGSAPASR